MNSFATPHHELSIRTPTANTIELQAKNGIFLSRIISHGIVSIASWLYAVYYLREIPTEIFLLGQKILFYNVIILVLIFIAGVVFNMVVFAKILTRNISKKRKIAFTYTSNFHNIYYGPLIIAVAFSPILILVNLGSYVQYAQAILLLILGIGIYMNLYMELKDSVNIVITKKDDSFSITATESIPIINFAPDSFVKKIPTANVQTSEMYLAIMPYRWNARYYNKQLRKAKFNRYQWLTLEQAKKISLKYKLTCYFVTGKTDFTNNFGLRIGNKLSWESLHQIYSTINEQMPISITQLT